MPRRGDDAVARAMHSGGHVTDVAHEIRRALSSRLPISDEVFDWMFPEELRPRSEVHWTPIHVALRVASLLEPGPGERVLDVGSGVGKVCLAGALATPASWYGIEQDRSQVRVAREVATALGVADRTRFLHGDLDSVEWRHFGRLYLYNPAGSILIDPPHAGPHSQVAEANAAIRRISTGLERTRAGTRVVTFHGFGATMPAGFELVLSERIHGGDLQLWTKASPKRRRPLDTESLAA